MAAQPDPQRDWVEYTQGRRRGAVVCGVGLVLLMAGVVIRASRAGGSSGAATALPIVGAVVLLCVIVMSYAVRPRRSAAGTAFLVLTPVGSIVAGQLVVANPNGTIPGRIVVTSRQVHWYASRGGELTWQHDDVMRATVRRVASFRPLGYVTITSGDGRSFEARVFQPRAVLAAFVTCGYPTS